MFCPECRSYWNSPQDAQEDGTSKKSGKKSAQPVRCSACGALLARDRLIAEFPEQEQAHQAGHAGERRLTVQDVLRETAGPSAMAGFNASSLDPRSPRSDAAGPENASGRKQNRLWGRIAHGSDWNDTESPTIPHELSGKPRYRLLPLDMILGAGALAAIAVLIASITIKTIFAPPHTKAPSAIVVNAASLNGVSVVPAPKRAFVGLPAAVGAWTSPGTPDANLKTSQTLSSQIGVYWSGKREARVWVEHLRSAADALARLDNLAGQSAVQQTSSGSRTFASRWDTFAGRSGVVFDAPGNAPAMMTDVPGAVALAHTRSWQEGATVITVASDTAAGRDNFSRAYIAALR